MKQVEVVAAVIVDKGKIFVAQRGYGEWIGYYELPGGKVEPGETDKEALAREIKEELATEVEVGEIVETVEYDYPNFHLTMKCYLCKVIRGELTLLEHKTAKWLGAEELDSVNWLPADEQLVERLKEVLE